jgi:hypothetical protein
MQVTISSVVSLTVSEKSIVKTKKNSAKGVKRKILQYMLLCYNGALICTDVPAPGELFTVTSPPTK